MRYYYLYTFTLVSDLSNIEGGFIPGAAAFFLVTKYMYYNSVACKHVLFKEKEEKNRNHDIYKFILCTLIYLPNLIL